MANVTQQFDHGHSASRRYIEFTSADLNDAGGALAAGDVLRVADSFGGPAGRLLIETSVGCDLGVKINSRRKVAPPISSISSEIRYMGGLEEAYPLLSGAGEITTDNPEITIGASAAWEWQGTVSDIELTTWTAGTWTIRVF